MQHHLWVSKPATSSSNIKDLMNYLRLHSLMSKVTLTNKKRQMAVPTQHLPKSYSLKVINSWNFHLLLEWVAKYTRRKVSNMKTILECCWAKKRKKKLWMSHKHRACQYLEEAPSGMPRGCSNQVILNIQSKNQTYSTSKARCLNEFSKMHLMQRMKRSIS